MSLLILTFAVCIWIICFLRAGSLSIEELEEDETVAGPRGGLHRRRR